MERKTGRTRCAPTSAASSPSARTRSSRAEPSPGSSTASAAPATRPRSTGATAASGGSTSASTSTASCAWPPRRSWRCAEAAGTSPWSPGDPWALGEARKSPAAVCGARCAALRPPWPRYPAFQRLRPCLGGVGRAHRPRGRGWILSWN